MTRTYLPSVLDRTGKAELRINRTIQLAITCGSNGKRSLGQKRIIKARPYMHSDLHVKLKHTVECQSVQWGPKKEKETHRYQRIDRFKSSFPEA